MSDDVKVNYVGVFNCSEKIGSLMDQLSNTLEEYKSSLDDLSSSIKDQGYEEYSAIVNSIIKTLKANKNSGIVLRKKMLAYAKELMEAQNI